MGFNGHFHSDLQRKDLSRLTSMEESCTEKKAPFTSFYDLPVGPWRAGTFGAESAIRQ